MGALAFGPLLFGFAGFWCRHWEGRQVFLGSGVELVGESAHHFFRVEIRVFMRASRVGESVVMLSSSMATGSVANLFK